jgi:hypothetical protein
MKKNPEKKYTDIDSFPKPDLDLVHWTLLPVAAWRERNHRGWRNPYPVSLDYPEKPITTQPANPPAAHPPHPF